MVCMRFSAWSKTIEAGPSNTSSVTLHARDTERLRDLSSDRGFRIVECRQAVHELDVGIAGLAQALARDTKELKQADALSPLVLGLAHRQPHVGIDEISARQRLALVVACAQLAVRCRGDVKQLRSVLLLRPKLAGAAQSQVHAKFHGTESQRARDVVADVTQEHQRHIGEVLVREFAHGHEVGQCLRRMGFVRQTVVDGDSGIPN
jgi:hypothetical protein